MADTDLIIPDPPKSNFLKVLMIGLPVFIVQLVLVYFVTANILMNRAPTTSHSSETGQTENQDSSENPQDENLEERGKFIFVMEDIIINPAGTDGKRLLLSSIGFDVSREEDNKELETKQVLVKDIVISLLSSKSIMQLGDAQYKDTLRIEIASNLQERMPKIKINDIYFSKYILQ
ncbi:MAG: flagellar basal body-associated FliL family protein [Ignavibacteria bacterium]|nr:flagellar basal body-associated FliL family protein [Ignavibacteria bacterium]